MRTLIQKLLTRFGFGNQDPLILQEQDIVGEHRQRTIRMVDRYWGHGYCVYEIVGKGDVIKSSLWLADEDPPKVGDFVLFRIEGDIYSRYRIEQVKEYAEPRRMYGALLRYYPRLVQTPSPNTNGFDEPYYTTLDVPITRPTQVPFQRRVHA